MARGRPKNSDSMLLKSAEMIGWAIGGIEREIAQTRERLATLTAQASQLRKRAGSTARTPGAPAPREAEAQPAAAKTPRKKRRKMSPEAKKRISEMMKKRWAERKRAK
jgi:hypothetical protein